jgi:hypothetical protein
MGHSRQWLNANWEHEESHSDYPRASVYFLDGQSLCVTNNRDSRALSSWSIAAEAARVVVGSKKESEGEPGRFIKGAAGS